MSVSDVRALLVAHRLAKYMSALEDLGVCVPEDLTDVADEDLESLGMTKIEKNRFRKLVAGVSTFSASDSVCSDTDFTYCTTNSPVATSDTITVIPSSLPQQLTWPSNSKSVVPVTVQALSSMPDPSRSSFCLRIRVFYPLFKPLELVLDKPGAESISLGRVILWVCQSCNVDESITVELYAPEGYPISQPVDCTVKELQLTNNDMIYAILRQRDLGMSRVGQSLPAINPQKGSKQIFVKLESSSSRTITIQVDVETDTSQVLKQKIYAKSFVPTQIQRLSYGGRILDDKKTLTTYNVQNGSTVHMFVSSCGVVSLRSGWKDNFDTSCKPMVDQTISGLSAFYAILYVMASTCNSEEQMGLLNLIQDLTHCPPLVTALHTLFKRQCLLLSHRVAISEGLFFLFRELIPRDPSQVSKTVSVGDAYVFESSATCWAYLLSEIKTINSAAVNVSFRLVDLTCPISRTRIRDPVKIHGSDLVYDRASLMENIAAGEQIPGCSRSVAEADLASDVLCQQLISRLSNEIVECWVSEDTGSGSLVAATAPSLSCTWSALEQKLKEIVRLEIVPPLRLKESAVPTPCLTLNKTGHLVVYTGRAKDVSKTAILFDPVAGDSTQHNPDELAKDLQDFRTSSVSNLSGVLAEPTVTRPPKEAIVVLLDVSASMDEECFGGTMTRIGAVKQLFHAFANRSMAYNYSHVIGLTLFGSTVKVVSKVSELFESFKKHVDDTLTSGRTALYDALVNASEQLDEFGSKYPDCIKRVLALTDGADNESRNTAVTAAQKLQSSGVRVDSVLVGQGNTVLKAISVASDSMSDGLKLFEMETVLSVQERKLPQVPPLVGSDKELEVYKNLSFYPYDKEPPYHTPDEISQPVTSAKRALHKAAINPPSCGGASAPLKIKRILREIANYQKNPHPAIEIYPCENRLTFWRLLLVGPKGTPYENGVFVLYAKFPDDYPSSPPEIRFVTPIYHCNVNNTGRICHSVFDRNYTTDTSIGIILACMYGLLLEPEPDDPLDSTLAEEYFSQRAVYDYHAREKTSQFAGKSLDERRKELCGGSDLDDTAPYHLKCPLTLELFRDPVLSPSGHTYERRAIEMHLQKTGGSGQDPLTNCDISTQDLVPNRAVKEAVEQYQKQVKQAVEWWQ